MQKWQARKSGEKAKKATRVSTSDPASQGHGASARWRTLALRDYNAQISTDAAQGLIVGVAVTQEPNDSGQLLPAVDSLEQRLEKKAATPDRWPIAAIPREREYREDGRARDRFSGDHAV